LPPLYADRLAIEQIFGNLFENAIKYLRPQVPGRIAFYAARHGDDIAFTVEDNGRGIAGKDIDRIFDPFRRAGLQDQPGEGIGLAHVRMLVRRLGGKISCQSEIGSGSRFIVTLPANGVQIRSPYHGA
jgi:signal transduction histidine kinase